MSQRSQLLLSIIESTRRRREEKIRTAMIYPSPLEDVFTSTGSPPSASNSATPLVYNCPNPYSPTKEKISPPPEVFYFSPTPTLRHPRPHLPRSVLIMDQRRPALPTESGGPPQYQFPQHVGSDPNLSTGSTESIDSIRTQVPLPYYLPQGSQPWDNGDQGFNQSSIALPLHGGPPKLNPSSNPYVPNHGLASNQRNNTSASLSSQSSNQTYGFSSPRVGPYSRDTSFSSASSYPAQQMGNMQYACADQYSAGGHQFNPQPHFQQGGMMVPQGAVQQPHFHQGGMMGPQGPPYTTSPTSYTGPGLPGPQGSYGHQGSIPMQAQYPSGPMPQESYNPYNRIPGHIDQYSAAPGSNASPAMSYTTLGSPVQCYQPQVYPNHEGVSQAWGSLQGPGMTSMYNNGGQYGGNGVYNGGSYVTQQRASYGGSSGHSQDQNNVKGKNKQNGSQKPDGHGHVHGHSHHNNKGKGKAKQETAPAPAPPAKDTKAATEDKSQEIHNRASSHPSFASSFTSEDTKVNSVSQSATPLAVPRNLNSECKSEPRFAETPVLRSRRGQSISGATATDPGRKSSAVTSWLETTPTNHRLTLEEVSATVKRIQAQSPPKMSSLLTGSDSTGAMTLNQTNDNDPFVSHRLPPFAQSGTISAVGPYRGKLTGRLAFSKPLATLLKGGDGFPTVDEALAPQNLPFVEVCRTAKSDDYGVIKIRNIPYSVNRPEVLAFLGRNARIVSDHDAEPVHIVMERVTSKTLDCYVEFINFNEAVSAVNRFETNRTGGRGGRLGQRHVEVELSCQESLMHDLFPKAKNVTWNGARPVIHPRDHDDRYNSGFQGFVSREELVMLVKHVEAPQRSPFSKECPQRPFECLISTLLKYPWYMVDYITIQDRAHLHKATTELLKLLVERVKANGQDVNLTSMLLKRVWKAALRCPGFTPVMKDDIVYLAGLDGQTVRDYHIPPFADEWVHLFTIGVKASAPPDLIMWYIAQIREATESRKPKMSLAEQSALGEEVGHKAQIFGDIEPWIGHEKSVLGTMTLGQVAKIEWAAIERILRLALTRKLQG